MSKRAFVGKLVNEQWGHVKQNMTMEQQSIKLSYSTAEYSSSKVPSSPPLLDTRHQHTWLFCIHGDATSMCH